MGVGLIASLTLGAAVHANDCAAAKHDVDLAQDRVASSANDEAADLFRHSIAACPNYDAYEQLAELLALSDQHRDQVEAVDDFVAANARATTSKARAQTLYQYSALLYRSDDPQNAYPLIKKAHTLDPSRREIAHFENIIETQIQNPKAEQLTRALRFSMFKPLTPSISKSMAGGTESYTAPPAGTGGGSLNIPIIFKNNSVVLDDQTAPHLSLLAYTLAGKDFDGQSFTFVGHTDSRGDDAYNVYLSVQRAKAVTAGVVALEPSLQGRISVEGRGAHDPIDMGTDAKANRANRRLQVFSK
jgi:outer membrane protein OmpA-like peptidoglycan-associated protein